MTLKNHFIWLLLAGLYLSGCATAPLRPPSGAGVYHIVGSGQNLYRISKAYGVSMQEIMRANNISNPNQIGVGVKLLIPRAAGRVYVPHYRLEKYESVENIVGEKQYKVAWKTITLHHSATKKGNAEAFDRGHRRRGMGGLFYHFVIGNGTASGDGEIEVGWRWIRQAQVNRKEEIEICLVGDFNRQQVSFAQYDSLLKLLKVLKEQYSIPVKKIRRHKDIAGAITECPGRNFPYSRLIGDLKR